VPIHGRHPPVRKSHAQVNAVLSSCDEKVKSNIVQLECHGDVGGQHNPARGLRKSGGSQYKQCVIGRSRITQSSHCVTEELRTAKFSQEVIERSRI